eukprot:1816232-Lingulodinium_polyedra.AAC.1
MFDKEWKAAMGRRGAPREKVDTRMGKRDFYVRAQRAACFGKGCRGARSCARSSGGSGLASA